MLGELRLLSLAVSPHVADPRLSKMPCGWEPAKTPYCGKLGKVIDINLNSVKLFLCGREIWWDTQLFDASVTRYCYRGCRLEDLVVPSGLTGICSVCLARVPSGAKIMRCREHDYCVCAYCLGHPCLPHEGEKVIRGPTWAPDMPAPEDGEDYYEEGVVETGLLNGANLPTSRDDMDVPAIPYHSCFQVRWPKSCRRSLCRGPPYQDVTPAFANGLTGLQPITEADRSRVARAQLHHLLRGSHEIGHC